jgi:hypothetical protein
MDNMLEREDRESKDNEDVHWLSRARYHLRNEEYWRDRAMRAESICLKKDLEIGVLKQEISQLKISRRPKKSSENFEEDFSTELS